MVVAVAASTAGSATTLSLLETHRLCCEALLEARIDVIDAVASKSVADELRLQLDEVARRVQHCELREAQLDDKVEAWAAGGVRGEAAPTQRGALASASLFPVATPRRKWVHHSHKVPQIRVVTTVFRVREAMLGGCSTTFALLLVWRTVEIFASSPSTKI
jgi:hypothetical protein